MLYEEARVYLDEMSKYGSVLGLDTIRGLLRELGNPQDDLKFIHIAGTNGKGSVLAYTSTILSEAGYRTGRYVSPLPGERSLLRPLLRFRHHRHRGRPDRPEPGARFKPILFCSAVGMASLQSVDGGGRRGISDSF